MGLLAGPLHMRDTRTVTVAVYPHSVTVSLGGEHVSAFDATGRVFYTFEGRRTYKWGLSGQVLEKGWERGEAGPEHIRVDLDIEGKQALLRRVQGAAREALAALGAGRAQLVVAPGGGEGVPDEPRRLAIRRLERAAAYDWERHRSDAARFRAIYRPVTILPPDQYLAVVLQATEGCSWNRCTFCNFYRDRPFRIRNAAEFRDHAAAVRDFLGAALGLRRTVFLADANALAAPEPCLLRYLEISRQIFPGLPVYSFLDVFTGSRTRGRKAFARLAERGLRRVYVGLETGSEALLRFLNKPGSPEDAVELVRDMKAAGLQVGVIVMAGAGGDRYAAEHVRETVRVVRQMELGPGDILYLSPFVEHPGLEYAARAREEGIRPLASHEVAAQLRALRAALRPGRGEPGPKVSVYDIREFIY